MTLSKEQKQFIIDNFNKTPDLIELTRRVFGDEELDGRTKEGRAVRKFLVDRGLKFNTTQKHKKEEIEFSQEQKEFMIQYAKEGMTAYEISKILFPEINVTNLSKEVTEVAKFIEDVDFRLMHPSENALNAQYFAPKSNSRVIKKINEYCQEEIDEKQVARGEMNNIESTMKFLAAPRFIQVINTYSSNDDRRLFEAEFIRATWDKPDLTADEINLYINVCVDYINLKNISSHTEKLNNMFNEVEDQQDMTVRLAEVLKSKTDEYDKCEKRMESLIKKLNGDRAERLKNRREDHASLLSLVKNFQLEEQRKQMIQLADMQKALVSEEVERLDDMESWKARILGISKKDAI